MFIYRNAVSDVIRDYLECEFEDKKKHEGTLVRGHMQPFYPKGLPRQKNYVDCGLYLLGFLDIFLQKPASLEVCSYYLLLSPLIHFICQLYLQYVQTILGTRRQDENMGWFLSIFWNPYEVHEE